MLASSIRLSKTKFLHGLQCHKLLWWMVHEPRAPELVPDASVQFIFEQGREVGHVAHSYVRGGVLINVPVFQRARRLRATAEALANGARVLYEGAFEHEGVLVLADILERTGSGWTLIEVKSSTRVKAEHLPDLAIQTHVLRGAGLAVSRAELMHLNRDCRHPDLSNLFSRQDCTEEVESLLQEVPADVQDQMEMLRQTLPGVEPGEHCYAPRDCPFLERCWPEAPPHAIDTLYRLHAGRKRALVEEGYQTLHDLPPNVHLTEIQSRQRRAIQIGEIVIDRGLRAALQDLESPLAFLDFETVAPAIPVWNGCGPYSQAPVQFSVHIQAKNGRLRHFEWLADGPDDPREALARALIDAVQGAGSILVYNATFERQCLQALAELLPHHATALTAIEAKLWDLLPVIRNHIYHPGFEGSFSLKAVFPALVPGPGYDTLNIAGGEEASQKLYELLIKEKPLAPKARARMRRDLLRYCETDTLALTRLLLTLRNLAPMV